MLIIDDYSRLTWIAFLKEKSEAFEKFKVFKALTENQTGKRLKAVRSDRGGEFSSGNFKELCDKNQIKRDTQFQGLHSKTKLLRGKIGQYSKWQDL